MKLKILCEGRQVGIFWIDPKTKEVISYIDDASEPSPTRWIESKYNHYDIWPRIRRRFGNKEYYEVPRGRVIYDKKDRKYLLYITSKYAKDPEVLNNIFRDFSIPRSRTEISYDLHYEDPEEVTLDL